MTSNGSSLKNSVNSFVSCRSWIGESLVALFTFVPPGVKSGLSNFKRRAARLIRALPGLVRCRSVAKFFGNFFYCKWHFKQGHKIAPNFINEKISDFRNNIHLASSKGLLGGLGRSTNCARAITHFYKQLITLSRSKA